MKLKKLKEETPSYEGRYWSYHKRKFVPYNAWKEERWCDTKIQTLSEQMKDELEPIRDTSNDPFKGTDIEGKD